MANPLNFVRQRIQERKVNKLARKLFLSPTALPIILQNSHMASIVLRSIKDNIDNEMPMLLFDWNNLGFNGFNDVPANPNLCNGVIGQTRQAIVANLIANGAVDYGNYDLSSFYFSKRYNNRNMGKEYFSQLTMGQTSKWRARRLSESISHKECPTSKIFYTSLNEG